MKPCVPTPPRANALPGLSHRECSQHCRYSTSTQLLSWCGAPKRAGSLISLARFDVLVGRGRYLTGGGARAPPAGGPAPRLTRPPGGPSGGGASVEVTPAARALASAATPATTAIT